MERAPEVAVETTPITARSDDPTRDRSEVAIEPGLLIALADLPAAAGDRLEAKELPEPLVGMYYSG